MRPLLDTDAASNHLGERGVRRTAKTLRKYRTIGGGPKFRRLNGRVYYTEEDLDAWIEEHLSAPVSSTSETPAKPSRRARSERHAAEDRPATE